MVDSSNANARASTKPGQLQTRDIEPALGNRDVAKIRVGDVVRLIQPVHERIPASAKWLRGLLERLLDYAKAAGLRTGDNPAAWKGNLEHLLGKRKTAVRHLPALPWREVPAFMERLRAQPYEAARIAELVILLGARSGEIRNASWSWIDWHGKFLNVPAEFVKARVPDRKPLPERAMEILTEHAKRREGNDDNALIFANSRGNVYFSEDLMRVTQACAPEITLHGFRSAFRDWAGETTNFPYETCEMAIGHISIKSRTEKAYLRSDLLEKRRALIEQWSKFCTSPAVEGKVVQLSAAAPKSTKLGRPSVARQQTAMPLLDLLDQS
jgi:integrase